MQVACERTRCSGGPTLLETACLPGTATSRRAGAALREWSQRCACRSRSTTRAAQRIATSELVRAARGRIGGPPPRRDAAAARRTAARCGSGVRGRERRASGSGRSDAPRRGRAAGVSRWTAGAAARQWGRAGRHAARGPVRRRRRRRLSGGAAADAPARVAEAGRRDFRRRQAEPPRRRERARRSGGRGGELQPGRRSASRRSSDRIAIAARQRVATSCARRSRA